MDTPCVFQAQLESGGPSFMPTQLVVVPPLVVAALGGKAAKRVVGTLNGYPVRLGLLPLAGGGRYLMVNKDICRAAAIQIGQHITVSIAPDPHPDAVDVPQELAEALAAWPEAEQQFSAYSASYRRAIAQHVATGKLAETRARRAVEMAERLALGRNPFRKE
ncbi:YdeI/OmpD-associated family protein [Hymenobacter tibetensis]|uniref:YdeI/OmpD-associated family protein n=1 Tax=Hymenobacter tibetensis TaxID=497967 RepID=A0ABY4CW78_9BACT|nr:YdeI/OmpD-associated family protein [Hymenobacter tibetensis]UOG74524.1 YdeI/OmpD-associated family protein [Hymenobacter tibetensis]